MSVRTVLNDKYTGLVDTLHIPAELHAAAAGGRAHATCGDVVPVHCCSAAEVERRAATAHRYCGIFTDHPLAPLGDIAYVRIDDNTAEKVFINRNKKMLIWSSDGKIAAWRLAPTFESTNRYVAGTPIVNKDGSLASVVTAAAANNYAVSALDGEGGYFETSAPWEVRDTAPELHVYGGAAFASRDELRAHVAALDAAGAAEGAAAPVPVLHRGRAPRVCLVAAGGRQICHIDLAPAITGAEYL